MELASPFLYQAWKHHLPFLKECITVAIERGDREAELQEGLLKMGGSVTDLYVGSFSLDQLQKRVIDRLSKNLLEGPQAYRKWLGEEGYRLLTLDDRSEWVLKYVDREGRWLHLHPSRSSPQAVRVRGSTLKTAFLVQLEASRYGIDPMDLGLVEQVRRTHLGLGPLRSLDRQKGVGRLIGFFEATP